MVKFRMSMKSDKGESKPNHVSIPPKDAIAIVPPKKVIKALYDYAAPDSRYLSFSQGDFLHVVDREDDTNWYEACNPLQGSRGMVPVSYFETVGKQARNSGGSARSDPQYIPAGGHDSGYADSNGAGDKGLRLSKSMSRGGSGGAMVYGVVMYEFKAERPDELDAKEGEAIIVIAQSNPEWFVAKPITRLGGPGLIPVSFVEIRDMATGKAVPDAQEAVQRAGVPKVEEWKKMAADYKNGSIPLGKLDAGPPGLQQSMARMSLGNQQQSQSSFEQQPNGYGQQQQMGNNAGFAGQKPYGNGKPMGRNQQMLAPVKASVPRYCFADEIFWFIVEAEMEDGRHWELSRLYQDFYDLQINLIQEFPLEAGNVKGVERSLPYMPGPVTYVTDNISNGRRANLDEYIRNLLKLGPHITKGYLVRGFFAPRDGDYEIDPDTADSYRLSSASQDAAAAGLQNSTSPQSSAGNYSVPGSSSTFSNSSAYGQGRGQQPGHMRGPSGTGSPPMGNAAPYNRQQMSGTPMSGSGPASGAAFKIKVWFDDENCVVIRMPPQFRYADLYKKLQDRRQLEQLKGDSGGDMDVLYRDEQQGKLFRIQNDDDLRIAIERNPKLTLTIRMVGR